MASGLEWAPAAGGIEGECDPRFERVREEFERNFSERDELGGAVCVIVDGEPVVDLWGGVADGRTGRPWDRDTMNVIMSCSKGVTAICAHILIDRGELDIDKPVAHYWPEFAQAGKEAITVRMAMSHRSGVAHVRRPVPRGALSDFDLMVRYTAETAPYWEPGTRAGYHGLTVGWIMGELIRRVSGKTPGRFLRDEVTGPLGDLDVWIGLPEEHEHRVARTVMFDVAAEAGIPPAVWAAITDPFSRGYRVVTALLRIRARPPCSASSRTSATTSAPSTSTPRSRARYRLPARSRRREGSRACTRPCHIMNRHGAGTGLNERGQSLVDAAYECLGSPGRTNRHWMRPRA